MRINVWLLMFCAVLTLTGCGVLTLAGNEDGLIKTGYYSWKVSSEKGSPPSKTQPIYIESNNNGFDIYTTGGICHHVSIKDNEIIAKSEIGQQTIDITGKIISQNLIDGECKMFSASTDKTTVMYYTITPDLAPQKDSDYFKESHRKFVENNDKLVFPKNDDYGRKMRAEIEKMAKEEDVSFIVKGKVIDSTGQPAGGLVIQLSARAYDPDGSLGMRSKTKHVTSNKDGSFESEALVGHLLSILYEGKEYQRFYESFKGKEELLKLKDNPVIIKLEPSVKLKN